VGLALYLGREHSTCEPFSDIMNTYQSTDVQYAYLCEGDYRVFDHDFFGIRPREAESMDPQQRILLEAVYESIDAAGYSMHGLRGSQTGVYVGQMTDDYKDTLYRDIDNIPLYAATGVSRAVTANRVSYFFDWHGPSVNHDTACSSSLVALHHAVQALRSGDISLAVVAGVNFILNPDLFIIESKVTGVPFLLSVGLANIGVLHQQLHMLSPTGYCRMWDESADGYARGEGVAAVVLKPLRCAIADNDHIECIIRETGVNQNGRTPEGLTVPNAESQAALIRMTYAKCGLDPTQARDRCQYFEAHGTGTPAGDPKEARAIQEVFFPQSEPHGMAPVNDQNANMLYVGSVKTVVGHQEGAAGLVGILKASLAVRHAQIPPNLHFEKLSSAIEPFYYPHLCVPTSLKRWPELPSDTPRRASVNSFGMGGTNAHAIIESWDGSSNPGVFATTHNNESGVFGPFTLSAHSAISLQKAISRLTATLRHTEGTNLNLRDLAWTLQCRRTELPRRATFSAATTQELVEKLEAHVIQSYEANETIVVSPEFPLRVIGVFTGQGAQWPRMGAYLLEHSPVFRRSICELDESLSQLPEAPDWSIADKLIALSDEGAGVHEAVISQPVTTALQIALVDLLKACGVRLSAAIGHSSGEITAAYVAGYISSRDAIRIAYYRGLYSTLVKSTVTGEAGAMMAVDMTFDEGTRFCGEKDFSSRLSVAACNAPGSITLSGDSTAIYEAKNILNQKGVFARILKVTKAYHSPHTLACSTKYLESLKTCGIQPCTPSGDCIWLSSVYGLDRSKINDPESLRGKYWVENMNKPVLFYQAIQRAVREVDYCFDIALEIGPHTTLRGPFTDSIKALTGVDIPYIGLLSRDKDDRVAFSEALGFIWTKVRLSDGTPSVLDWNAMHEALYEPINLPNKLPQLVSDLPPYGWDHEQKLFFESRKARARNEYKRPL